MTCSRVDVSALRAAVDAVRVANGLSWREVALEAGVSPSTLSRMGRGKGLDVHGFACLVHWLGVPADRFLVRGGAVVARRAGRCDGMGGEFVEHPSATQLVGALRALNTAVWRAYPQWAAFSAETGKANVLIVTWDAAERAARG